MKMTFRTGIWVRIPTSKQLSGMGATRRMPNWYAADYFPPLDGRPGAEARPDLVPTMPREHAAQSLGCLDEGVPAQVEDHPPQSSIERESDAGTDKQEDSSPAPWSEESEVADPSWLPPPVDALLRG